LIGIWLFPENWIQTAGSGSVLDSHQAKKYPGMPGYFQCNREKCLFDYKYAFVAFS
jgi:hypothetical protein